MGHGKAGGEVSERVGELRATVAWLRAEARFRGLWWRSADERAEAVELAAEASRYEAQIAALLAGGES
jgi:hypothetical protein